MGRSLRLTAALLAIPSAALAQFDGVGLGSGRDGPLVVAVDSGFPFVNAIARLTAPVTAGSTRVLLDRNPSLAQGDVVMFHQVIEPSLVNELPDGGWYEAGQLGLFELATVASYDIDRVNLTAPLVNDYDETAQALRVPQYTDVTIAAGAVLPVPAWDGDAGAVVAFIAKGTVTVDGTISASGRGFRGGPSVFDVDPDGGHVACSSYLANDATYGRPGEGAAGAAFFAPGLTGRFPRGVTGGGGGPCSHAGGGGGAGWAAGGFGGWSYDGMRDIGGFGGYPLYDLSARLRLIPGSGGGAGHSTQAGQFLFAGSGGGAVFIRAAAYQGSGDILAAGTPGSYGLQSGAFGGGGGGSVVLEIAGPVHCGHLDVSGGRGGDSIYANGPGGGGGGGHITAVTTGLSLCEGNAGGGAVGLLEGTTPFGGGLGNRGVVDISFFDAGTAPRFLSTPDSSATCGVEWHYSGDRAPTVSGAAPLSFSTRSVDGGTYPAGLTVDAATGALKWTPSREAVGAVDFDLVAQNASGEADQAVRIVVDCPSASKSTASCGCATGMGAGLPLLWALALRRRRPAPIVPSPQR